MNLKGKTILVTGASSGIGQAIAIAVAQKGATAVIAYRKNKEGAEHTLKEVEKYGVGHVVQADLSDQPQVESMFKHVSEKIGFVDMLVNNAGHAQPSDFFDNEQWRNQFANIFFSALNVSQQFLKHVKNDAVQKIINITSIYGNLNTGNNEFFAYSAAKAALSSLTVTLAKRDSNILVNAIAPGYVWTPAWEGISDAEKKLCESKTMIGRFIMPEEIAHMAVAILENDAITGQVVTVDGGLSLQKLERK